MPETPTPPASGTPASDPPAPSTGAAPVTPIIPAAPGAAAPPVDPARPPDAPASTAPASYTASVPADATRLVHEQDVQYLKDVARANGWTQAEFQGELDAQVTRARDRRIQTLSGWEAATRADVTYGGTHLVETQRLATLAIEHIRPAQHPRRESFLQFLNESGGNVHLEVVAFLADLGRLFGEDQAVAGRGGPPSRDRAALLYDNPSSIRAAEAVRQRVAGERS